MRHRSFLGNGEKGTATEPLDSFQQGDMLHLTGVADNSFRAIAAFYSIIHIPPPHVVNAFREMKRVLQPSGVLLLAFHIGKETVHKDEWWGHPASVDFIFYDTVGSALWAGAYITCGFLFATELDKVIRYTSVFANVLIKK